MSNVKRLFFAGVACAAGGLGVFAQQQWAGGQPVGISAGQVVNITVPEPAIPCFTNNGTLVVEAGGSVSVTGSVFSVVGAGGGEGMMTVTGNVTFTSTRLIIGNQGGTGTLHVASGGLVDLKANNLYLCWNNSTAERVPDTRGFLDIEGTVKAAQFWLTGNFPNASEPYVEAGIVRLLPGGVLEVSNVTKNDRAYSKIVFEGGTFRMVQSPSINFHNVSNGGYLYYIIESGCEAIFDTAGSNVTFNAANAGSFLSLTGDGGLRKKGAGSLVFTLADTNNTFTGDIVVEQGTLDLGRPLEQGQEVTVHNGAAFVIRSLADVPNVHVVSGGTALFTVGADIANLDLTALSGFYTDRLGGPLGSGTATLSERLGYDDVNAGILGSPFRLIGQGGTLTLTNTGLETAYLQLEGQGRFTFIDDRVYTPATVGKLALLDSVIYRQQGKFTLAGPLGTPAVFSLAAPNQFETAGTGNALEVGYNGDAEFHTADATMNIERLRIGGGDGVQGRFAQDGGTVTLNAESWVGYDNGTGRLDVVNGTFIVNNADLRLAAVISNPRNMYPDGQVTVSNGLLRCNTLNFTPTWNTTDTTLTNRDVGRVYIQDGGVLEINNFNKNDNGISTVNFDGGLLRARGNNGSFIGLGQALGTVVWRAPADQFVIMDTQGYSVSVAAPVGKLNLAGDGGFKKRGTGLFGLFASRSDYKGDTIVEAGTLRLLSDNSIPSGLGYGNLALLPFDSLLDLYGKTASINTISGLGMVTNSSSAASTLNVLANGADDLWEYAYVGGNSPITLVKQGGGTLTLQGADTIRTPVFKIEDGTVRLLPGPGGYRFYRFKIEGVKNAADPGITSMQFSQLALYYGPENVVPNNIGVLWDPTGGIGTTPGVNAYPSGETPDKVVNGWTVPNGGSFNNKWNDFRALRPADADRVWIRLEFPAAQPLTSYNWATGNDQPNRDPSAWRLQGSQDGSDWKDIDVKTGFSATGNRNSWVMQNGFPVKTPDNTSSIISIGTLVSLSAAAALDISGGLPQSMGGLSGWGSVALDGTDLILGGAATPATFSGTVTGSGNVIIDGGNQTFNAQGFDTGDFIVRSGTVQITPVHNWFRFTIQDIRSYTNVQQISEFALYTAGNARCNLGLTLGASAAALNPGQFWTPAYTTGNGEVASNLFDNATNTKWCLSNNFITPEDPASWRTVTMRLANGLQEVTGYNMCTANDAEVRDPVTWMLESSPDGLNWQTVDTRTKFIPTTTRYVWYNSGVPFDLQNNRASAADGTGLVNAISDSTVVEVCYGATLAVNGGTEVIGALRVDMAAGAGTITRFTPAANGTLHLTNASGAPASWAIPIAFGSVDNPSVLSTWQVLVNGVPLSGYSLFYDPIAGQLKLRPQGTILLIK